MNLLINEDCNIILDDNIEENKLEKNLGKINLESNINNTSNYSLEEIRMVIIDDETFGVFRKVFLNEIVNSNKWINKFGDSIEIKAR